MKLFLDTNVLIDFILERQPFYQAAAMIISYAVEDKIQICASFLSFVTTNFICIERCKMPIEIFRNKINFLREFIDITSVDKTDIYNSYDSLWKDFEDGVQYYSAKRANVDYIVTRNTKDFEKNDIKAISLDETIKILKKISGKYQ